MLQKYPFRKFEDLSRTIKKNVYKLPQNLDLIVGVPRSGMIPAYMIGLFINKRVCSLNELLEGILPGYGKRIPGEQDNDIRNILIVDDSICTGRAILEVKEKTKNLKGYNIEYLAIYTNNVRNDLVDYTFEYVATPRLFQWNYMNMVWTQRSCFDMDGVLCVDPVEDENDDGEKYRNFILNAKPLFIPQFKINTIVTSRLEKYRKETESWLKQYNVQYERLIMLDLPTKEDRIRLHAHASYKAHVYKNLEDTSIFIESDSRQAQKIAIISGKTVICASTDEIFYGDTNEDRKKIEEKVKIKAYSTPKEMQMGKKCKEENIEVSIIIPVHNVENYLQECLNTIRFQSFDNIEIICVNDGSTDNSLDILKKNAEVDERIIIIDQPCSFAGVARNKGLEIAQGKYVLFLDGDDFFEHDLVEKVYNKISSTQSDICLFKCRTYDNDTHEYKNRDLELRKKYIPKECFSYEDIPDYIFNITTGAPWSKMFRRKFIMENEIRFQDTHHYNDFYFVMCAMATANRITYIDEALVNYRINRHDSLQANMEVNPLEFTVPLVGLKENLLRNGIYDEVKRSFQNRCLATCLYVLFAQKNFEAYKNVYCGLKDKFFEMFDLTDDINADDIYIYEDYARFIQICEYSAEEYLFEKSASNQSNISKEIKDLKWKCKNFEKAIQEKNNYIAQLKEEYLFEKKPSKQINDLKWKCKNFEKAIQEKNNYIKQLKEEINDLEYIRYCYYETLKSKTYKIGRMITWFPRLIKEWVNK